MDLYNIPTLKNETNFFFCGEKWTTEENSILFFGGKLNRLIPIL